MQIYYSLNYLIPGILVTFIANKRTMRKILPALALLILPFALSAQKVKINDDIASVDGTPYLSWEKRNAANEASVRGLDATEEEVYLMYLNYSDPNEISKSNPEGKVRWIEVNFLTLNIKCEISSTTHKGMVKLFYENNLYTAGKLNEANVEKFVQKYGTRFSDNRPGGNVNIIINN